MSNFSSNIDFKSTNVRNNYRRIFVHAIFSFLYILFPGLIDNFISKHFFVPNKYPATDEEKELLEQSKAFQLVVDNETIMCWQWGNGPFILLAHGWNGHGSQFIYIINALLKSGHSVITFDGPAHGQSEGRTSSYFQMSDAVRALINHIQPEHLKGLIGHSFGASAIINAVSKESVDTLVILISPALDLKRILESYFLQNGIPLTILYKAISEYEERFGYNLEKDNPLNLLKSIDQEVLIIHDEDDIITSFNESKRVSEVNKSLILKSSRGLGHKRILFDKTIMSWILEYLKN